MAKLSIIILSYNTRDLTLTCVETLFNSLQNSSFSSEIIIVDNASKDGSVEMLKSIQKDFNSKKVKISAIFNKENTGYPKGNNIGLESASGEYILFLNSDVLIKEIKWDEVIGYMDHNDKAGALTVRVMLPTGELDRASHRGFPTAWNAFSYYSGLEKVTSKIPIVNKWFGGYHLTHERMTELHSIDSPSGAFYLTRRSLMDALGGFDETFFMYGEDLDLSYRIKEAGYDVIYYPSGTVLHLKYQSGLKKDQKTTKSKTRRYFYEAMRIFYKKHYEKTNPSFLNKFIYLSIRLKERMSV